MYSKLKYSYLLIIGAFFITQSVTYSQLSFNDALAKAKSENKKIIVDVYTDWCGWCKKMDAEAYSNSDVKKIIEESFIFVKLNAEGSGSITYNGKTYSEQDLASLFEVSGYPTTVFLEPDGKQIEFNYDTMKMKSVPGYFKTDEFKKILIYFKESQYKETDLSKII